MLICNEGSLILLLKQILDDIVKYEVPLTQNFHKVLLRRREISKTIFLMKTSCRNPQKFRHRIESKSWTVLSFLEIKYSINLIGDCGLRGGPREDVMRGGAAVSMKTYDRALEWRWALSANYTRAKGINAHEPHAELNKETKDIRLPCDIIRLCKCNY